MRACIVSHICICFKPQQVPVWQIKAVMISAIMQVMMNFCYPPLMWINQRILLLCTGKQTLNENAPPMRIYVNRMNEEFSADVLAIYKKPNPGLNSTLRVKFENEVAVGEGPVREFFSTLMGFLHDGFPLDGEGLGKLTEVFEGQEDHKLPIPNALLRNAGFYKSVGRMIAHSFLHGGPPLFGLSPAVVQFWCQDSINAVTIDDVPDYDLREALKEVSTTVML